jgi:hypothetical protein
MLLKIDDFSELLMLSTALSDFIEKRKELVYEDTTVEEQVEMARKQLAEVEQGIVDALCEDAQEFLQRQK